MNAAENQAEDYLKQAGEAFRTNPEAAIVLATKAVEADPKSADAWSVRGRLYEQTRRDQLAVADYSQALRLRTNAASLYQQRGWSYLRLARFKEAIADFDKFLQLQPGQEAHHWQRGIAYYYAGEFEKGRRQFEVHQTVNANDVENAVWHYLCVARLSGVEKARASLIPIQGDARVPMMQVHALFAGKVSADSVLDAANENAPPPRQLEQRLFYAHLYLGLYYEAAGDTGKAREHIIKAADGFKAEHAMGDVARVHASLLRQKQKAP